MKNKLFHRFLTLLLICSLAVPAFAAPTRKTEQEMLDQLFSTQFFPEYFNLQAEDVTLSKPITIYYTTENYDQLPFSYYAGKSLSAFNLQDGGHLYFVETEGEMKGFFAMQEVDGVWQILNPQHTFNQTLGDVCIGSADHPLIEQYNTLRTHLESIGKGNTEIAYLWMYHALECLFTPDLYNGYAINASELCWHSDNSRYVTRRIKDCPEDKEKYDAIYRTRDVALSIWNYFKTVPVQDGITYGSTQTHFPIKNYPPPSLLPEEHYSVTGFWCLMIGIPVVLFGAAILIVRIIRRKKQI